MVLRFLERYINCWIVFVLALSFFAGGCSVSTSAADKTSSQKEINGVKIIKTTDSGDDVVTDNNGNQFTVKQEEESIHIYCLNYKTETTELLPVMEIDGSYATDLEMNEHEFTLDVKDNGAGNKIDFWMFYTYDSNNDILSWNNVKEDLGTNDGDNLDEELKNYIESDNMKSLCNELITTVKAYQQLKDN